MYNGYNDVKGAVRDQIKAIWMGWLLGGAAWVGLWVWTDGKPVIGQVIYVLLWVLGGLSTLGCIWATWKLLGKENRAMNNTINGPE